MHCDAAVLFARQSMFAHRQMECRPLRCRAQLDRDFVSVEPRVARLVFHAEMSAERRLIRPIDGPQGSIALEVLLADVRPQPPAELAARIADRHVQDAADVVAFAVDDADVIGELAAPPALALRHRA